MRLTIIVDDNLVMIGGKPHTVDCSSLVGVHAVQWYDTFGEIEYKSTFGTTLPGPMYTKPPNVLINDISPYQNFIDAWQVAEEAQ